MSGRIFAIGCAAFALAPSLSAQAQPSACPPVELRYDESEQLVERRADTNKDCRQDEFVFYENGIAARAERDTDFDGRVDAFLYYEEDGKTPARQDQDTNKDGKND